MTKDISGLRFGALIAKRSIAYSECERRNMWLCSCDCGSDKMVRKDMLIVGRTKSCGCGLGLSSHGESYSPEYQSYHHMIKRTKPTSRDRRNYFDRGITVCDRWRSGDGSKKGFECFFKDLGRKPTPSHSLDRYPNNDGNYEPSNCRWATPKEQSLNQRKTKILEYKGERFNLQEAADKFSKVSTSRVYQRLREGWTVAETLEIPDVSNGHPGFESRPKKTAGFRTKR